jgi:transposase
VYNEVAKAELVTLCLQPGASVSRLARECGVNANQVGRWLRERGHARTREARRQPQQHSSRYRLLRRR